MGSHAATLESYNGIELALPDGTRHKCKALTTGEATRWFGLLVRARNGEPRPHLKILDDFLPSIGISPEETFLTPAEVFEVLDGFLSHSRTRSRKATTPAGPEGPEQTSSTMASTTS